jgi:hypothetical protein
LLFENEESGAREIDAVGSFGIVSKLSDTQPLFTLAQFSPRIGSCNSLYSFAGLGVH